jgi:hypothetical protein
LPWPGSDDAGMRIDLSLGRGSDPGIGCEARSSCLTGSRHPLSPVERQPNPSRRLCALKHAAGRAEGVQRCGQLLAAWEVQVMVVILWGDGPVVGGLLVEERAEFFTVS